MKEAVVDCRLPTCLWLLFYRCILTLTVKFTAFEMYSGWREFDDSKVREISESCVTTKAAYVLFYRRCAAPVITVPPPASVPTTVSAPINQSFISETAADLQATAAHPVSSSHTADTANRKTVTPVAPAAAEFNETTWQTDMDAID